MSSSSKIVFCANEDDERACQAIEALKQVDCETKILNNGEKAPQAGVFFFTPNEEDASQINFGKWLRLAVHRIRDMVPQNADEAFPVAVRPYRIKEVSSCPVSLARLEKAVRSAALLYETWLAKDRREECPWGQPPKEHQEEFEQFKLWAASMTLSGTEVKMTPGLRSTLYTSQKKKKAKGRGWAVQARIPRKAKNVQLSVEQRQKRAAIVSAVGAFNFPVGMECPDSKLDETYKMTIKSLALVAELSQTGAGEALYRLTSNSSIEHVFIDMVIDRLALGEKGIGPETPKFLGLSAEEFTKQLKSAMEYLAPQGELKELKKKFLARVENLIREGEGNNIHMNFYPKAEALLVFGRSFESLSPDEQQIARQYKLTDESKHFQRIMDPDLIIVAPLKKLVGVADAENQRMLRLIGTAIDYRRRLGLYKPWPMPGKIVVESANFANPLAPTHIRSNAPYIGAAVSASTPELAKDLVDLFRRLISQHSIEKVFPIMEDWLMRGDPDPKVSLTAFQIHNNREQFLLKAVGIGGGAVHISGSVNRVIKFPKAGQQYGDIEVGRLDFQHPIHQTVVQVQPGDVIEAIPATLHEIVGDKQLRLPGKARLVVSSAKHKPVSLFEWTYEYVKQNLSALIEKIKKSEAEVVRVQFGHIHSDRDLGPEQETGAFIAKVFVDELRKSSIRVEIEPMVDNYHVVDRLDVERYLKELSHYFGEKINDISFEASLLSRRLGDEAIIKIHESNPDKILTRGQNVYLQVSENMLIELYDGVGPTMNLPGRQGCVPFEVGYEIRRLNPELASKIFRSIIFRDFPKSVVADWWREDPEMDFETLTRFRVYGENPERRTALKYQMDSEIDLAYRKKIANPDTGSLGNTVFLDRMLHKSNPGKQVLVHFLEGIYDAQHTKFSAHMALSGLLPMDIFRVSFERHSGRIVILDANSTASKLGLL